MYVCIPAGRQLRPKITVYMSKWGQSVSQSVSPYRLQIHKTERVCVCMCVCIRSILEITEEPDAEIPRVISLHINICSGFTAALLKPVSVKGGNLSDCNTDEITQQHVAIRENCGCLHHQLITCTRLPVKHQGRRNYWAPKRRPWIRVEGQWLFQSFIAPLAFLVAGVCWKIHVLVQRHSWWIWSQVWHDRTK